VATAHPAATEAGIRALRAGGNAVDAAVAAAWALCVCEPSGSGLGGQTVVIVLPASGAAVVLDGHAKAPAAASKKTVTRAQQRAGYRATTVPTTPMTLGYLQERFGRLAVAQGLEAAIGLAEAGYEVTALQSRQLRWCADRLLATEAAAGFLCDGRPYRPGERFRQPGLAACLRRLTEHGVQDFYCGEVARAIADDMKHHDGLLAGDDLEQASPPVPGEPLGARYRNHLLLTTSPPAGGPQLLGALAVLDRFDPAGWHDQLDDWYGSIALAIHSAFLARERAQQAAIAGAAVPSQPLSGVGAEVGGETTHLCTADADGNVVSLTQSIQSLFGAKVANAKYGFLYNNYLTTCPRRRGHHHQLSPGCSARSNAAPTIVLGPDGRHPRLALGAAGSRRIISSLVHVASAVLDLNLPLRDALALPRAHPRLSGRVWLERPAATPTLLARLDAEFREVELLGPHSYAMGAVQALEFTDDGAIHAAADPRREGVAMAS
jgi:gamma-glutamyltranspeptidase / glutathione hydrolase